MTQRDGSEGRSSVVWTMLKVLAAATACGIVVMIGIITFYTPKIEAQHFVEGDDPELPRLEYEDGLISPNNRCIVAQRKLNKNVKPIYVNGQPIGFC